VAAQLTRQRRLLRPEETTIGEWAALGRKTGGHDEACWTVSDGWAERKNEPAWEMKSKKKVKRVEVLLGRQVITG
jgi:hypothetical protein